MEITDVHAKELCTIQKELQHYLFMMRNAHHWINMYSPECKTQVGIFQSLNTQYLNQRNILQDSCFMNAEIERELLLADMAWQQGCRIQN